MKPISVISHIWNRLIRYPLYTCLARAQLAVWGVERGKGLRVLGRLRLNVQGQMKLGSRVRINSGTGNFVGGEQRLSAWVGRKGRLVIEDGCALSNSTLVVTERIEILHDTFIGGGCLIVDSDLHALEADERIGGSAGASSPVCIGPRAFLGARVIVLKGAHIGDGAVIGAGSVVHGIVPAGELWAGVPARKVRALLEGGRTSRDTCGC